MSSFTESAPSTPASLPVDKDHHRRLLVIGPDPDRPIGGGVVTHVRSLRGLNAFAKAEFVDIGDVQGKLDSRGILSVLRNIGMLKNRIAQREYDAIVVNASIYDFSLVKLYLTLRAIGKGRIPILVFYHGGLYEELRWVRSPPTLAAANTLSRRVACSFFLSEQQEAGFHSLFPGVLTERFSTFSSASEPLVRISSTEGRTLRLLFCGRVVREKGVFELVEATKRLSEAGANIKVTIAGEGEALPEIRKDPGGLGARLDCLGYVSGDALIDAYLAADVFVLPTYHPEGLPYAVIEAMRAGLPVVCTGAGSLAEVVEDGVHGLRVPPKDPTALTRALGVLYEDRSRLRDMSIAAQTRFRERLGRRAAESFYEGVFARFARSGSHHSH